MMTTKVLIVDDDQDFAESVADVLELNGYQTELAFSGEEAVEKFREMNFDLAFMDVQMPGKNGVESFLEIREFKPSARVIILTAYAVPELLEEANENGIWRILHKPVNVEQLLESICEAQPDVAVLVVDDDSDFAENIQHMLESAGYAACIALSGEDALVRLQGKKPSVLILDLRMPIMGGLEVYTELQKRGCNIPTVVVTAYATDEMEALNQLKAMSVQQVLEKPFEPTVLIDAVRSVSDSG